MMGTGHGPIILITARTNFGFIEDNTIKGSGSVVTSGGVDSSEGGRYVARHNYVQNTSFGGHGTEGGPARGQRCDQVYNNTFYWTIGHGGHAHRSGSTIWHDNTFLGRDPGNHDHTNLPSSGNWAWLAMTYRTGALRTATTDGIRTILTAYISAEQRRAIQRLAGQVGHLLPERP